MTIGNPAIDVVAVVSQSSDVWVLKSYTDIAPSLEWKNFSSPEDSNITNAKPFRTYDGKLLLAAISKGGGGRDSIYLLDVTNTDQPWSWDEGVYSNVTIIRDFIPDSTFWHPSNASKFGYLITGDGVTNNQPGVIQLTGAVAVPVKVLVDSSYYSSPILTFRLVCRSSWIVFVCDEC